MMMADNPTPSWGTGEESACIDAAADDAAMLKELAQIGMRLARLVEANAEAKMALDPAADLGRVDQAFAKISRSVRQTLALKTKLAELTAKREAAIEKHAQTQLTDASRTHWRKVKLQRAVAETIEAEAGEHDAENLLADLHERLEDPDIETDLAVRSMGAMVASVCDDLGIPRNREIWERKGWYLIENWRAREPAGSAAPVPARSYEEITAEALAMFEETTHPAPARRPGLEPDAADDG